MTSRKKSKYPNLDTSLNTLMRRDYIETDYINGVRNSDGVLVIRPLNEEEKTWLNKFYGETITSSDIQLNPTEEINKYMKMKSTLRKEIAKLRREGACNSDPSISFKKSKISKIEECLDFLRKEAGVFYSTCEEHRALYSENNKRNSCIYNNRKARGMLLELTEFTYDSFIAKYWDSLASFGVDSQDKLNDIVEKRLEDDKFLPERSDYFEDAGSNSNKK